MDVYIICKKKKSFGKLPAKHVLHVSQPMSNAENKDALNNSGLFHMASMHISQGSKWDKKGEIKKRKSMTGER